MSTTTVDDETATLTTQARALRARVEADRAACLRTALEVAGDVGDDPRLAGELEYALQRWDELGQRLASLPDIEAPRESGPYARAEGRSFFQDLAAAAGAPMRGVNHHEAQERLQRHADMQSTRAELARGDAERRLAGMGIKALDASEATQERALSVAADPGAVPPRWLTELFASVVRAAAPLPKLVTNVDLPPDTLELRIPRFTSAAGVVPLQLENTNAPQTPAQTDELVSKVATFAGDTFLSQQLYERGAHFGDAIVIADFAENYAAALQQQLINGTGTNGELLGLLSVPTTAVDGVPGARLVTYTSGSPTIYGLTEAVGQCAGQVSDTRLRPPSVCLMRGSRWFQIASTADANHEPTVRPGTGSIPTDSDTGPHGPYVSLPVYLDATIPNELGTGKNQDAVVLVRAKDIVLLEDPLGPRFSAFTEGDMAGQMTTVLQWHHYTAAITNRYPSGIGRVEGTGLAVPAGF